MAVNLLQTLRFGAKRVAVVNRNLIALLILFTFSNVSTAEITGVRSASRNAEQPASEAHSSMVKTVPEAAEETGNLRCWQSGELIIDEVGIAFLPIKDGSAMVTFGLNGTVTSRLLMEGDTTCLYKKD